MLGNFSRRYSLFACVDSNCLSLVGEREKAKHSVYWGRGQEEKMGERGETRQEEQDWWRDEDLLTGGRGQIWGEPAEWGQVWGTVSGRGEVWGILPRRPGHGEYFP